MPNIEALPFPVGAVLAPPVVRPCSELLLLLWRFPLSPLMHMDVTSDAGADDAIEGVDEDVDGAVRSLRCPLPPPPPPPAAAAAAAVPLCAGVEEAANRLPKARCGRSFV